MITAHFMDNLIKRLIKLLFDKNRVVTVTTRFFLIPPHEIIILIYFLVVCSFLLFPDFLHLVHVKINTELLQMINNLLILVIFLHFIGYYQNEYFSII